MKYTGIGRVLLSTFYSRALADWAIQWMNDESCFAERIVAFGLRHTLDPEQLSRHNPIGERTANFDESAALALEIGHLPVHSRTRSATR